MYALKGIVVFMGLIIVTLMILIVYGMIQKAQNPDFSFFGNDTTPDSVPVAGTSAKSFPMEKIMLDVARGSTIEGTDISESRMAIRIDSDGKNGADTIVIVDINSGKTIGIIGINP
ncbi:MAG: hypothetical protein KAQ66_03595 [Rhodospirillaceae bacterium]|nr:hypothetical protein [Rhodospirillaceae bacterium]